ncbi:hypothetical protein GQ55_4G321800 [Panicum hallii var. hallii]|uniref:Uncharacterized protein n=1 Tax=Panicum hallii var. hallii TaxID=1504633 RepID=A0A2T7E2A9_9POAL|nr:hypothetical protein GQ55_4G321800 [Panicum hallii var. hallii]
MDQSHRDAGAERGRGQASRRPAGAERRPPEPRRSGGRRGRRQRLPRRRRPPGSRPAAGGDQVILQSRMSAKEWCLDSSSFSCVRTIRHLFCKNIRMASPAHSRGKGIFCCIQVTN